MNSRRKFLRNSGLAASAILAAKPFNVSAGNAASFGGSSRNLTLLHTANSTETNFVSTASAAASLKRSSSNAVLVNTAGAGTATDQNKKYSLIRETGYDAVHADMTDIASATGNAPMLLSNHKGLFSNTEQYRIIYKGAVKTGLLSVAENAANFSDSLAELNRLAKKLKEERGCHLVVCMSSLGYTNKNHNDDLNLAKGSLNIDIIISGNNNENVPSSVILNSAGSEVLIDSAANRQDLVGKIGIGFDRSGNKNSVSFG